MSSSTNRNPVTTGPTSRQQLVAHTLAGSWLILHFELWSGRCIKITRLLHLTHRNNCGYLDTDENASPLQMIYKWRRPISSGRRGSRRRYFCLMTPDDLAYFIVTRYMKQSVSAHRQACETSMHSEINKVSTGLSLNLPSFPRFIPVSSRSRVSVHLVVRHHHFHLNVSHPLPDTMAGIPSDQIAPIDQASKLASTEPAKAEEIYREILSKKAGEALRIELRAVTDRR